MNRLFPPLTPASPASAGPSTARLVLVYCLFVAIVCVYTYPLVLKPGSYLRGLNDPYLFTWMLIWVSKTIFTDPLGLFDANIFFPYGNTLAFSEPLIVPAVTTAAPVYGLTGNPILAYNVTLILFQALCGWSAYYAARRITGSEAGALLAGILYCASPFRTGYYNYLNIHLSFAVPLAFLAFALFLERQQYRYLVCALALVWIQAITIWYGGIPLTLLLCLFTLGFLLLRPGGWRVRTPLALVWGGAALVVALLPVAWPYFQVTKELGFERSLADVNHYRADLLSFFDAGREHLFYQLADSTRYPGLFPGFTIYILSAVALVSASRDSISHGATGIRKVLVLAGWLGLVLLVAVVFLLVNTERPLPFPTRAAALSTLQYVAYAVLVLGLVLLAAQGRLWQRQSFDRDRSLSVREWSILLSFLVFFSILLTLGPVMHLRGEPFGTGIYAYIYEYFPGFKAIRISLRLAFLALFMLGLLAAFGVLILESRLRPESRLRYLVYVLPVVLAIEYLPARLTYHDVDWESPPEAYRWLASQDGDFAILEFPTKNERIDSTYVFWSLYHGKRLVTGVSGFYPPLAEDVAYSLAELPESRDIEDIKSIYGLRYLLIHLDWMPEASDRAAWRAFRNNPPAGLREVGVFDEVIVFEIERRPDRQWTWVRNLSTDWLLKSPTAKFSIHVAADDREVRHHLDVGFNGAPVKRFENVAGDSAHRIRLPAPYRQVRPNRLVLHDGYRITEATNGDPAYEVGRTGTYSPVDIVVTSAGKPYGSTAVIWVNGENQELPRYRGYNVAVFDPQTGNAVKRSGFDTRRGEAESRRLVHFFERIRQGRIVAVALNQSGGAQITDAAFQAFRSVGASSDPREHPAYSSHVLIGVKGAPPGTAVEAIGGRSITRVIGVDRRTQSMAVSKFRLTSDEDAVSTGEHSR